MLNFVDYIVDLITRIWVTLTGTFDMILSAFELAAVAIDGFTGFIFMMPDVVSLSFTVVASIGAVLIVGRFL